MVWKNLNRSLADAPLKGNDLETRLRIHFSVSSQNSVFDVKMPLIVYNFTEVTARPAFFVITKLFSKSTGLRYIRKKVV